MIALATVRVRCLYGKVHSISVMENGRLHFHDHDRSLWLIEDLIRAADDGRPLSRCSAILRMWRSGAPGLSIYKSIIPKALQPYRKTSWELGRCSDIGLRVFAA